MKLEQRIALAKAQRVVRPVKVWAGSEICPFSGLPIKPVRLFGHQDEIGPDHHGPTSRWEKQARRRAARRKHQSEVNH